MSSSAVPAARPHGRPSRLATIVSVLAIVVASSLTLAAPAYAEVGQPTITGVSPNQGPVEGGTMVTITGEHFKETNACPGSPDVFFGTTRSEGPYAVFTDTTLVATAPAHVAGTVHITIRFSCTTAATPADLYTYGDPSSADLSVTVADSADPAALGDAYTNTITVTNGGTSTATSVSAATTYSGAASSVVSATSSQGSCTISAPTVTCAIGSLADSASATITVTVEPQATGTVTATSTASATETDPVSGNNTDAESTTINNGLGCTITGTAGNDTLNGTNGSDVICGLGGNDTINGGNSDDTIYGGTGNDTIDGGNSDDVLYGGPGDDVMGGGNGADYLYGEAGNDTNYGETLLGSLLYLFDNGNDHIYGGPGNDDLDGQNGNDVISDTDGNDTDTMSGGLGNDSINVQDGAAGDTANGGLGTDTCTIDTGDTTTSC